MGRTRWRLQGLPARPRRYPELIAATSMHRLQSGDLHRWSFGIIVPSRAAARTAHESRIPGRHG
jgi:hypothetical protein